MNRILRMVVFLIVATVISSRLPVNLIVAGLAALSLEELHLGDIVVLVAASLCLDHLSLNPLGISIVPLAAMMVMLHLLRSHIYLQSAPSRLLWLVAAVFGFYVTQALVFLLRGTSSLYIVHAASWGLLRALVEGALATLMAQPLHRYLTVTWEELMRPKRLYHP